MSKTKGILYHRSNEKELRERSDWNELSEDEKKQLGLKVKRFGKLEWFETESLYPPDKYWDGEIENGVPHGQGTFYTPDAYSKVEFYNGSNGSTYMTWGLSGVINDQDNGFGALSFSGSRGLQNGGNDGIALVDSLGQVVQFISYEGQLIAMNGAAQGAASLDIGIAENSSTAVGMSVQLVGSGKDEQDFIWQAGTSSFGSINSGQTFVTTIASEGLNQLPILKVPSPNTMVLGAIAFLLLSIRRIKAHVPSLGMINKRGRVT